MDDLREHLTAPLDQGGHFLTADNTLVLYPNWERLHEDDHAIGGWWTEALMHAHEGG